MPTSFGDLMTWSFSDLVICVFKSTAVTTLTLIFHSAKNLMGRNCRNKRPFLEWHSFYFLVSVDLSGSDAILR
jgi:hypothetical protein